MVFLTTKDINKYFSNIVSRPGSRRDVIGEGQADPNIGVFSEEVLAATNWYRVDPPAIDNVFKDMINSVVLENAKPADAIGDAAARVTSLMRKQ